jgi:hypothetical protein
MTIYRKLTIALVATVISLAGVAAVTTSANASQPLTVQVSKTHVPYTGGTATVRAYEHGLRLCAWSSVPAIKGFNGRVACQPDMTRVVTIPATTTDRSYLVGMTAYDGKYATGGRVSISETGPATVAHATLKQPKASAMLLSIRQMPVGWSVDNSKAGSGDAGCMTLSKTFDVDPHAAISFESNGGLLVLGDDVITPRSAKTLMHQVVKVIAACPRFTGNFNGTKVTGSVGAMSFPRIGDQSDAYSAAITAEGITFTDDFVIVRRDNVLMQLQLTGLDPNVNMLIKYARLGVDKLW